MTECALREALVEAGRDGGSREGGARASRDTVPALNARVLLVEDNAVNAEIALAMLQGLGCTVTPASNGEEAVAHFGQGTFDIILMDCQMPGMDGFEATSYIRSVEAAQLATGGKLRRTPIVALTANALSGDRERCISAGMDDHLGKPFTRAQLHATVARWLGRPG